MTGRTSRIVAVAFLVASPGCVTAAAFDALTKPSYEDCSSPEPPGAVVSVTSASVALIGTSLELVVSVHCRDGQERLLAAPLAGSEEEGVARQFAPTDLETLPPSRVPVVFLSPAVAAGFAGKDASFWEALRASTRARPERLRPPTTSSSTARSSRSPPVRESGASGSASPTPRGEA